MDSVQDTGEQKNPGRERVPDFSIGKN